MNKKQSDSVSREEVSGWLKIFPQDPNCTLTHESTLALALSYIRLLDSSEQTIVVLRRRIAEMESYSKIREDRFYGLMIESASRAEKIRELVPDYMKLWAPLDAVRVVCEERDTLQIQLAQAQRDMERLDWLQVRTIRSSLGPTDKLMGIGEYLRWSIETKTRNLTVREAIDAARSEPVANDQAKNEEGKQSEPNR